MLNALRRLFGVMMLLTFVVPAMASAQSLAPPETAFRKLGDWSVRLDRVHYGAQQSSRDVRVEVTVRNDARVARPVLALVFEATMLAGSYTLTPRSGFPTRASASVAPGGEQKIFLSFSVGDAPQQSAVRSVTIVEKNLAWMPGRPRDHRATLDLPRLPASTATQQPTTPQYTNNFGGGCCGSWRTALDTVTYSAPEGTDVIVVVNFTGNGGNFRKENFLPLLQLRQGDNITPHRVVLTSDSNRSDSPVASASRDGFVRAEMHFRVGDVMRQQQVHMITLRERKFEGVKEQSPVQIVLPGYSAPPPPPPSRTPVGVDLAQLKTFEGRYRTNRGTTLTFQVEGQELVGRGGTPQLMNREEVKLTLHEDGSLRGTLRDTEGAGRFTWYQLNLRFAPDGARFAGQGAYMHASLPPISYTGERIAETTATTTAPAPTPGAAAGGFTDGGYLSLRADMVRHSLDQYGRPRMEVGLTARNTQGQRRSLQHNSDRFFLITADGVEHRMDGNYYGASVEDRLIQTVWVEKDEEAQVTYVFAGVPATAKPARLIVRDSMNRQQLASIDLSATPSQRPAVTGGGGGQPSGGLGQAITLNRYEVTLEKIERGPDGNWHSIMTVKNVGDTPLRPAPGSLNAVLYGADGQARHAGGNWYDPVSTTPVVLRAPGVLQPGAQFRVRRVHGQSTGLNPVRFRAQEGPKSGEVSLSGAP